MTDTTRPLSNIAPVSSTEPTDTNGPRTGWRLEYIRTGLHSDTIAVGGVLDGDAVWSFRVLDLTAEYQHPMVDVVVPHYSFLAFTDARGFFTDLAIEGPNTLAGVRGILDRHGFVEVTEAQWVEGQR